MIQGIKNTCTLIKTLHSLSRIEELVSAQVGVFDCVQTATRGHMSARWELWMWACMHTWMGTYVCICIGHTIHLVPQIFCHRAGDCWLPGQLKPLLFYRAGCGGACLTLRSLCGQWPPHTGSTKVGFFPPQFPVSNLHTHWHKHLNTRPHVDMHACPSHMGCGEIWFCGEPISFMKWRISDAVMLWWCRGMSLAVQ